MLRDVSERVNMDFVRTYLAWTLCYLEYQLIRSPPRPELSLLWPRWCWISSWSLSCWPGLPGPSQPQVTTNRLIQTRANKIHAFENPCFWKSYEVMKFWANVQPPHMLHVTCHMSHVTWHCDKTKKQTNCDKTWKIK